MCALLIKFPIEELIVFIEQKRGKIHAEQSFCVIEVFTSTWDSFAATFQVFVLARPPQAHHVGGSFVSMLELSCLLLVPFVFAPRLLIIQLCERR